MGRAIFITGTDTGSGKTVLTALLTSFLLDQGIKTLAIKPFCSGSRSDVNLLSKLQGLHLSRELINPYFFKEPVAPLVAARLCNRRIPLSEVVDHLKEARKRCAMLLVEGSGGVLAPLGEGYGIGEVIAALEGEVLVSARNQLGVINHARLSVGSLKSFGIKEIKLVLMAGSAGGLVESTNPEIIRELVDPAQVFEVPWFKNIATPSPASIYDSQKKIQKTLAEILEPRKLALASVRAAIDKVPERKKGKS